jgi:hypothetical protein
MDASFGNKLVDEIKSILSKFEPISLDNMKEVKLMNRIDTKYIVTLEVLIEILQKSHSLYYVQTSEDNSRMAQYHTIYLDTVDKAMFVCHETGRKVREKIRMRTYLDTNDTFLEIKDKNNHGRTKKRRIVIPDMNGVKENADAAKFLSEKAKYNLGILYPHLENRFNRITLVNKDKTERLTIDLELGYHNFESGNRGQLNKIAIIELKRSGLSYSPMKQIFMEMQVRENGFSKYCICSALSNPTLRQNNFKERIHHVLKMNGDKGIGY